METLTIGQLARRAKVNLETIRYYERRGLIAKPPRNESGYRQYQEEDLTRLRFIHRAKDLGFSLKEIIELLSLRRDPGMTCQDVKERVEAKIDEVERKIDTLETIRRALAGLVNKCTLDGPAGHCPILKELESQEKGGSVMSSETTENFDLIIIGGGAGGFAAAIGANDHQAKTLMVNAGLPLGGTCVNVGCVPSKRLLWAAETLHMARNWKIPGIELNVGVFDLEKLIDDELGLVSRMQREKYHDVLENLESVTFVDGSAKFISEKEIEVNKRIFRAPRIIIATGSKAKIPPIDGLRKTSYTTHIEALKNRRLPENLTIIGAGPVAVEFAQMFSRFGSKVTMVKRSPGILRFAEKELTKRLEEILADEGIDILTVDAFQKAAMQNGKKEIVVSIDGKEVSVPGDEILVGTGKVPNTEGLGLEKAGVEVAKNSAIVVNEFFQTSKPHIYAVGDVINMPLRLETTAAREGTLAARNALMGSKEKLDYDTVPFTVFTDPQLAGVGLTEQEQMRRMGTCLCRTVPFEKVPKAILTNRTEGLIKMAIHPTEKRILGVHILGPNAGDLIAQAMTLIKNRNTIGDVVSSLPMFPTLSESLKAVALSFERDLSRLSCCV